MVRLAGEERERNMAVKNLEVLIETILIEEAGEHLKDELKNVDIHLLALRLAEQVKRWYSQIT